MEYTLKAVKLEPVSSANMADPHSSSHMDIPRNTSDLLMVSSISIKEEPMDLKIELADDEESLFDFLNPNLLKVPIIFKKEVTDDASLGMASTKDGDLNCTSSSLVAETLSQPVQENVPNTEGCAINDPMINFDNQSNEFTVNRRKLPSRPKLGEHNEMMMYMMHEPELNLFKSFTTIPPQDLWSSPDKVSTSSNNDFTGFSPESSAFTAHKLIRIRELIQNCSDTEDEESILSPLHRNAENVQYQRSSEYFSGVATNRPVRRIKRKRYFDEFSDIDSDSSYSPPKKQRSLKKIENAFLEAIESFEEYDSEKDLSPRRNTEKSMLKNSAKRLLIQISGKVDDYYNLNPQNCSGIAQVPLTYKSPARKNYHPSKRAGVNQHHYNVRSGEKKPLSKNESAKNMCSPPNHKYSSLLFALKNHNLGDIIKRQTDVEERIKARLCKTKVKDFNEQESEVPKNGLMRSSSSRDVQSICSSHSPEVALHKLTPQSVNKKFAEHHQVSIKSAAMIYLQLLCFEKSPCTTDLIYPSTTLHEDESSYSEDSFDPVITSIHSLRDRNCSHCSESEKEYDQQVMDSEQEDLFEKLDSNNLVIAEKNNSLLVLEQQSDNSHLNKPLQLENELKPALRNDHSEQGDHCQHVKYLQVECVQRVEHVKLSECAQNKPVHNINHTQNVDHGQHVDYAQHVDHALRMEHVQLVDNASQEKEHLQQVNQHPIDLGHQNKKLMLNQFGKNHLPSENNLACNDRNRDILHKCDNLLQDLDSHHVDEISNMDIMYHNGEFNLNSVHEIEHAMDNCNEQVKNIPVVIDPSKTVDEHLNVENLQCVNESQRNTVTENHSCIQTAGTVGAFEHAEASTQNFFSENMSSMQINEQSNRIGLDGSHISLAEEDTPIQRAESSCNDSMAQEHNVPQAKLNDSILVGKSYTIEQSKSINRMKDASSDCLPENPITKKSCPIESIQSETQTSKIPHLDVFMSTGNDIGQVEQQNLPMIQRENSPGVSSLQQTEHNYADSSTQVKFSSMQGGETTMTPTQLDKATKEIQFSQQPLKSLARSLEFCPVASLHFNDRHSSLSKESTTGTLNLQLATQGAASTTCSREKLNYGVVADHPIQALQDSISSSKASTSSTTLPPPDLVTIDSDEDESDDDLQVLSENLKKASRSTLRLTLFVPQMLGNKSVSEITKHYSIVQKNSNGIAQEVTLQSLIDNCDSNGKVYLKRKTTIIDSQLDNSDDIQCLGEVPSVLSQTQNKSISLLERDSATPEESPLVVSEEVRNSTSTSETVASCLSSAVKQSTVQLLHSKQKSVEQYLRHRFQSQSNEIQKRKTLSLTNITQRAKPVVAVVQPMISSSFNADLKNDSNTHIT